MSNRLTPTEQAALSRKASAALSRAAALVSVPAAVRPERTVGPLQNRVEAAVRASNNHDATAAWTEATSCWWALAGSAEPIARYVARRWAIPGMDSDDVHQEARLGLYEGARRWNPEGDAYFTEYVKHWVRSQLNRAHQRSGLIRLSQSAASALGRRRRDPSLSPEALGMTRSHLDAATNVATVLWFDRAPRFQGPYQETGEDSELPSYHGEQVPDDALSLEEATIRRDLLRQAFGAAGEKLRTVVRLRLCDMDGDEIAERVGRTHQRVSQQFQEFDVLVRRVAGVKAPEKGQREAKSEPPSPPCVYWFLLNGEPQGPFTEAGLVVAVRATVGRKTRRAA